MLNNNIKYLLQYEQVKNFNDEQFIHLINETPGIHLKELKAIDLVFYNGEPIYRGVGVYVFKNSERIYYVGNCVARSFTERIPAHFDIRKVGWFNSLLRHIVLDNKDVLNDDSLQKAAKIAFNNLSVILINFEEDSNEYTRHRINNLEKRLGTILKPLNKRFRNIIHIPNL
jgi:hypothetical protein